MMHYITQFNPIILTLVTIDFFVNGAMGLVAPFFAVFVTQSITGGLLESVGFAAAIFWMTKSILQLPISWRLDATKGERDEFWAFFAGYIAIAFVPLFYAIATSIEQVYIIQAFFGTAAAVATPAWNSIFTRHLDRKRISFEWSLWGVFSVGIATTVAAAVGGVAVERYGFDAIFVLASVIMFLSSLSILLLKQPLLASLKERRNDTNLRMGTNATNGNK